MRIRHLTLAAAMCWTLVCCHAVSPNFYHRIDVTTGNLYTFAASNLLSAGVNKLADDRLLDTSFGYTYNTISAEGERKHARDYNRVGVQVRDLFADCSFGIKLGYQSFDFSWFNWGLFVSAHYKANRFKWEHNEEMDRVKTQRIQPGVGVMLSLGDIESGSRVIIEAGIRYNIPTGGCGDWGDKASDIMNRGVSGHYSLRFGGRSWLQGIGIFAEIPHYHLLKAASVAGIKLHSYTFGITYSICPWNSRL